MIWISNVFFINNPDPDSNPDPKLRSKYDPDPEREKKLNLIISAPQHRSYLHSPQFSIHLLYFLPRLGYTTAVLFNAGIHALHSLGNILELGKSSGMNNKPAKWLHFPSVPAFEDIIGDFNAVLVTIWRRANKILSTACSCIFCWMSGNYRRLFVPFSLF